MALLRSATVRGAARRRALWAGPDHRRRITRGRERAPGCSDVRRGRGACRAVARGIGASNHSGVREWRDRDARDRRGLGQLVNPGVTGGLRIRGSGREVVDASATFQARMSVEPEPGSRPRRATVLVDRPADERAARHTCYGRPNRGATLSDVPRGELLLVVGGRN